MDGAIDPTTIQWWIQIYHWQRHGTEVADIMTPGRSIGGIRVSVGVGLGGGAGGVGFMFGFSGGVVVETLGLPPPPPPQAAINTKAAAANIGNGKTERRGIERFILFILNVFSISVIDYSIISPPFPLSPSFPSKSSSFPPPPTRGQIAAGINCHRAANADGAKRHLTTGGKAAAN